VRGRDPYPPLRPGTGRREHRARAARMGVLLMLLTLFSCAGRRPDGLGVREGRLAPCPASPNCVSSEADDAAHRVEPLRLAVAPAEGWAAARSAVAAMPRTEVVRETESYLHAEARSRLLGFVDDLELHLRPEAGEIAVRSASRMGYSDLGVNRQRVETLRERLRERGAVR